MVNVDAVKVAKKEPKKDAAKAWKKAWKNADVNQWVVKKENHALNIAVADALELADTDHANTRLIKNNNF